MRNRNGNFPLKIATVAFAVFMFFVFMWQITSEHRKSYLDKFILNKLYAKIHTPRFQIRQNGEFWILENYIMASKNFYLMDSVTYTTHGEYPLLDNIEELVKRWRAPLSVAIFAPGADFYRTLHTIDYLRNCNKEKELIQDLVTFHIYFPADHMPSFIPKTLDEMTDFTTNCSVLPTYTNEANETYRQTHSISYPINVGRNIARRLATTYFIFPCDIEMYPSWNFVKDFLNLIDRKPRLLFPERQVFVLAVFELEEDEKIPGNKAALEHLIQLGKANCYQNKKCPECYAIPMLDKWIEKKHSDFLNIFLVTEHQKGWEPFYVTTNFEPFFDERFTWETGNDKQIQADLLSIMDFNFIILDKAFLVHRPGTKLNKLASSSEIAKTNTQTETEIRLQLKKLYA